MGQVLHGSITTTEAVGRAIQPPIIGNWRERPFFEEGDCAIYCDLLAKAPERVGTATSYYYMMPNHAHIIAAPVDETGSAWSFAGAHRRHTDFVNI